MTEEGDDHLVPAPRGAVGLAVHPALIRQLLNFRDRGNHARLTFLIVHLAYLVALL